MLLGNNIKAAIQKEIGKLESLKKVLKEQEKNYGKDSSKEIESCDASINHYKKILNLEVK